MKHNHAAHVAKPVAPRSAGHPASPAKPPRMPVETGSGSHTHRQAMKAYAAQLASWRRRQDQDAAE